MANSDMFSDIYLPAMYNFYFYYFYLYRSDLLLWDTMIGGKSFSYCEKQ